jgi:NAD(P)-dependent dehydrogenase (short-subunit alcohol dehydrogenase family)
LGDIIVSLQDTNVVVIGGSSGIGFAVAKLAAEAGAKVIIGGRNKSRLAAAAKKISGSKTHPIDVSDETQVVTFFDQVGELDHLVITAGGTVGSPKKLVELPTHEARAAFDNKFWGQWLAVRHAVPRIRAGGSIGLTSGILSRRPGVGRLLKTTINAAIEAMGRTLAKELAPTRVYVVSPGAVDTGSWSYLAEDKRRELFANLAQSLPAGCVVTPEDTAAAYLFAMQNRSLTGVVIDIDSGQLVN